MNGKPINVFILFDEVPGFFDLAWLNFFYV